MVTGTLFIIKFVEGREIEGEQNFIADISGAISTNL